MLLQREFQFDSGKESRRLALPNPLRASAMRGDNRFRRRAGERIRCRDQHRRAVRFRAAREPHPCRIGNATSANRTQSRIERDELKSGRGDHLRRHHRLLHRVRTNPQQSSQIDADRFSDARIEMIAEIDEYRCFTGARRGGKCGDDDRETSRAVAGACKLDDFAARQAAAEEFVEGLERGWQKRFATAILQRTKKLRRVRDFRRDARFERRAQLAHFFALAPLHGRWRGNERRAHWRSQRQLKRSETSSGSSHGKSLPPRTVWR